VAIRSRKESAKPFTQSTRLPTTAVVTLSEPARVERCDGDIVVGHVLLVDDDVSLCQALAIALRARGWRVDLASDELEAVDMARCGNPELVLLDLEMSRIGGLGVIRALRATSTVPIVVLSARDERSAITEATQAGADGYEVKPVGIQELIASMRSVLRRSVLPGAAT